MHEALAAKFATEQRLAATTTSNGPALIKYVPIQLRAGETSVNTYAFIDEGSSVTMVKESLADELGVNGVPDPLTIKWIDTNHYTERNSRRVGLEVDTADGQTFVLKNVHTREELDLSWQTLDAKR